MHVCMCMQVCLCMNVYASMHVRLCYYIFLYNLRMTISWYASMCMCMHKHKFVSMYICAYMSLRACLAVITSSENAGCLQVSKLRSVGRKLVFNEPDTS